MIKIVTAAVTTSTKTDWVKIRKCSKVLFCKCFSLLKRKVYQGCVQSPMLCSSEKLYMNDKKVATSKMEKLW